MTHSPTRVPVGFRFHPTDEELVGYYLPKKVTGKQIDRDLIKELDLYKLEPWDLQDLCKILDSTEKQADYYFFSRKDKKYPTGNRANRATTAGFWKATGRDKPIICTKVQQLIGMRKTLVFYEGRAPHGNKTDWIMHEFRLDDGPGMPAHDDGGWVVCRVFKKTKNFRMNSEKRAASFEEQSIRIVPEIMSSPEILSGTGPNYPFANNPLVHCKQETNLDAYNVSCHDPFNAHLTQLAGMSQLESNHAMPLPSAGFKGLVGRNVTRKDMGFFREQYALENNHISPSLFTAARCNDNNNNNNNPEDIGLPALDDWGTLCESTGKADLRFPTATRGDQSLGDVRILLQLKRQISDLYSSNCEFHPWNYNQMYQK